MPFAIRELIANALDEQMITGSADPLIVKDSVGRWHVADAGRGLRYEHLTQNESAEKRSYPQVIGQFGMGLKDALAVFDRRGIDVVITSPHAVITTGMRPKEGFPDVVTLHALVDRPDEPQRTGTDIILTGASDEDVETALRFLLRYSGEQVLESTELGDVIARAGEGQPGRVYVRGLLVAEEPDFLFSYNITRLSAPLRRALNRERANVGRTAYSDRVKAILKLCRSGQVAVPLAEDLGSYSAGDAHDEIKWNDVAVHACQVLQASEDVVFVTANQLRESPAQVSYAEDDGYRPVVVPDNIANKLGSLTDLRGKPMVNLERYRDNRNESLSFRFVSPAAMTPPERAVYARTAEISALVGFDLTRQGVSVEVSETMRLNERGDLTLGLWQKDEQRIVVRRDQLRSLASYAGTLLHEIGHATSGTKDSTLDFEEVLTELLGLSAAWALGDAG